ncbi:hypothetical protein DYB32_005614 [Aphanomyces invadans]|uniref:Amino acid transporter n=1 Tax=Aphanomyces invadans TaxID=157072 RepID=A0A418AU14_9STRA|nr:hypothetical protein DYB32_005614 [Aphanomyces invadans]
MAARYPPRGELRTDFRQFVSTPDPDVASGAPIVVNFDAANHYNRASVHSSHSSQQSRRKSSVDNDTTHRFGAHQNGGVLPVPVESATYETDVAILGASQTHLSKPQELNDEYYAYLWTIEGAWYKKLYFGIWGIVIAIVLGVLVAFMIDTLAHADVVYKDLDALSPEALLEQFNKAVNLLKLKQSINEWIYLPGDLLIRGLSCLIVPMIFVNVTIGVADIYSLKKGRMVGWRMLLLCLVTTILAVGQGMVLSTMLPDNLFRVETKLQSPGLAFSGNSSNASGWSNWRNGIPAVPVNLLCPMKAADGADLFMNTHFDRSTNTTRMVCSPKIATLALTDLNRTFKSASNWLVKAPTAEAVFFNLTDTLVTDNIVAAFTKDGQLVSLVMFAIPLGIALAMLGVNNPVIDLFRQLNSIFLIMIGWVINFVPVAVIFLVASAFLVPEDPTAQAVIGWGSQDISDPNIVKRMRLILPQLNVRSSSFFENLADDFKPPLTLLLIFILGSVLHMVVVLPGMTFLCTRRNPFSYMMQMSRAINFGFGSGSSLAALPITVKAIDNSQTVSHQLTRFLLPIGTGIHLDGAAFYLAACTVFLLRTEYLSRSGAEVNPEDDTAVTASRLLIMFFTCVINSWSCPPLPHGGLVGLMSVWAAMGVTTLSGTNVTSVMRPTYFVWIVAIDVLLDRFSTVMNIMSNALIIRIIAEQIDETYIDEQDRLNLHVVDDEDDD